MPGGHRGTSELCGVKFGPVGLAGLEAACWRKQNLWSDLVLDCVWEAQEFGSQEELEAGGRCSPAG